jgi:hypothetical protein
MGGEGEFWVKRVGARGKNELLEMEAMVLAQEKDGK